MFKFFKNSINKEEKNDQRNDQKNKELIVLKKIDDLNNTLIKSNIIEITSLIGNRKELFFRNFIAGIARGIGIGLGVTIITACLIAVLQKIVTLNIPILGEYISDIVDIVTKTKY